MNRGGSSPKLPRIHGREPPDPVELLRALLRFDTSNPPGNERACVDFLAEVFRAAGLDPVIVGRDPERPNLVVRHEGKGSAPPLLLHGHVDVVPADDSEWRYPPFSAELVDGEVWGRGALDMKSGVAMLVTAMLRATHAQPRPAGDLILALLVDEEAGSDFGARFLVEERADLLEGVRYSIGEGGGATQWIGGRPFYPIAVSEKQRCLIRATIRGTGGHPAFVVRGTAMEKLGRLLTALEHKRLPVHVTPVVRTMLTAMSAELPLHERLALRPALVPAFTDRLLDLFGKDADSLDPLLHNTATPTVVRGGGSTNVVATEVSVEIDGRLLPGQAAGDLVRELQALVPRVGTFEVVSEEPAVSAVPNLELYPMLAEVVREHDPGATPFPLLLPGYTDARYFAQLGIQNYGFLPLRLPPALTTDLAHAPNERVSADGVSWGAGCIAEVIRRYGSGSTG